MRNKRKGPRLVAAAGGGDPCRALPADPGKRGYHFVYRRDEVNRCPGCGRTHWLIGRLMAECGFCATALPLAEAA